MHTDEASEITLPDVPGRICIVVMNARQHGCDYVFGENSPDNRTAEARTQSDVGEQDLNKPIPLALEQIRARARRYREAAETATSSETRDGLIRLAERFEALAKSMEDEGQ